MGEGASPWKVAPSSWLPLTLLATKEVPVALYGVVTFTRYPFFHFSLHFWERFWNVRDLERR